MTDTNQQASNGELTEAGQQNSQDEKADGGQPSPTGARTDAVHQPPAGEPPEAAVKRVVVYAAIAMALGILVGVAFATIARHRPGRSGPHDLGPVVSNADGLTGHLFLNWGEKLGYRLVVEPSDPGRNAEFSLAVSSPPRPLSFDIQLKDPSGYALCGKTIVLKYDPRQAAALAASDSGPRASTASAGNVSADQKAQAIDLARAEDLELQREQGQDIIHNDIGKDGESESISSRGEIPCSRQAYERTASWSFSPDFPTLDEQAKLLKREVDANAPPPEISAVNKASAARKKAKKRAPEALATFAIEGDDELVAYDTSRGIIQTSARKTFVIDKSSAPVNSSKWAEVPANIHYKCDLNAACTLSRKGAVVLYARLMR